MNERFRALLMVLVALIPGCTLGDDEEAATPFPRPRPATPLIATLPNDCAGIGNVPRRGQVTFISSGRLYGATPDGERVRCLARADEGGHPSWGGSGDRILLQLSGGVSRVIFKDGEAELAAAGRPISQGLSRPRGLSALFITASHRRLYKVPSNGGKPEELSFLKRHDEAVYHPAGEHIAVVGERADGTYGIFLATNIGTDPKLLVVGEDAKRIFSLSFSPRGFLYYAAEHEDHFDVHGVALEPSEGGGITTSRLETYYSTADPITRIVVSPFHDDGKLAIQVGSGGNDCPSKIVLHRLRREVGDVEVDPSLSAEPIGWLPNGDLVFQTLDDNCDSTGAVYTYDLEGPSLLIEDAYAVAVRGVGPPAPDPPDRVTEVVA